MANWIHMLKDDPVPWLLEENTPAVRHLALRQLLDQPENAPDVLQASAAAMQTDPIASILAAQHPEGFWVKSGPGYAPKYRGTVWQVIFLDQLGADGRDTRVHAANERLPCAWGAIKGLLALARIPPERRAPHVERAIQQGVAFLLSCDPATAAYPSGYVTDVLQNLTVLCELGFAKDIRLLPAIEWLLGKQDQAGRWKNQYAYNGKTWVNFERQGQLSKWVTLPACSVLKMVYG
jgi:hypothetical protein